MSSEASGVYVLDVTESDALDQCVGVSHRAMSKSGDIDWIAQGDPELRLTAFRATILEAAEGGVVLCARDEGRIVSTVHLTAADETVRAKFSDAIQELSGLEVPKLTKSQYRQISVADTATILERRQRFFAALSQSAVESLTQFQDMSGKAISISGLATDPECQGRGYAQAFVHLAISAIDRAGLESVLVVEDRDKMHALLQQRYASVGFTPVSDYDVTDAQDGSQLKVICMKRAAKSG